MLLFQQHILQTNPPKETMHVRESQTLIKDQKERKKQMLDLTEV